MPSLNPARSVDWVLVRAWCGYVIALVSRPSENSHPLRSLAR